MLAEDGKVTGGHVEVSLWEGCVDGHGGDGVEEGGGGIGERGGVEEGCGCTVGCGGCADGGAGVVLGTAAKANCYEGEVRLGKLGCAWVC